MIKLLEILSKKNAIYQGRDGKIQIAPCFEGFGVWQQNSDGFWEGLHRFNGDKIGVAGFVFSTLERAQQFAANL